LELNDKTYLSIKPNEIQVEGCIILSRIEGGESVEDCQFKSIKKDLDLTRPFSSDPLISQRILK